MKTNSQIGLWLDHSQAHFIDFSKGPAVVETTYSNIESQVRFRGEEGAGTRLGNNRFSINEHHLHNRKQELLHTYYHMLADRLKKYDNILLFGATHAKDELYNRLKDDKAFADKSITVKRTDHLTENQMIAEAKKFFNL